MVDRVFDEVFEPSLRARSNMHWTPVEVAMRASKLLAAKPDATILDIGAGIGKFCIIAAAAREHVRVRGVEHRPHFVVAARQAARAIGVEVDFQVGTLDDVDPTSIDGVYLFNPFAENLSAKEDRLDDTVELSEERFWRDVRAAEEFLRAARVGTRVVTYCGFGGSIPEGYELVRRESCAGTLELWVKKAPSTPAAAISERPRRRQAGA